MQTLSALLPGLFRMSCQASVLILLVLAVQWLFGARLKPRWRYLLWGLVMLRLALPWSITVHSSFFNHVKLPAVLQVMPHETASVPMTGAPVPPSGGNENEITTSVSSIHWLLWIWGAGMAIMIGGAILNYYLFHRRIARQRPLVNETALNLLEDCKTLMAVEVPVALVETNAVQSPTLFGFIRPRLLLPVGFVANFNRGELRHVFLHELAHLKRHDILMGWLAVILQAIHWFNPLVWLAFYRMRVDRELACDALALSYSMTGENESYGLTIVKLLDGFGRFGWRPGLAGILESKKQLKERIRMIAKFHKTERGLALAISVVAMLALVTFTHAQSTGGSSTSAGSGNDNWNIQDKLASADAGNEWAMFDLWDTYYYGKHGIPANPDEAGQWLAKLVQNLSVVRFEPVGNFAPRTPAEFLNRISQYAHDYSGRTNIGAASFFRTTKQGDKLVASFLSNYPNQLKADLSGVPGLKVTSVEPITPEEFVKYEESPQESLDAGADARREKFNKRMALDVAKYTQEQMNDAEQLYQVANRNWGTKEAVASLKKMVEKYPDLNRTGCAALYLAQMSRGKARTEYLQDCMDKYADCFYGDGVQVGAYASLMQAQDYKAAGDQEKAQALLDEIKTKYPDAVDHAGNPLLNNTEAN